MEKAYALTTCARFNCANKKYLIGKFAAKIHSAMGENVLSFAPSGTVAALVLLLNFLKASQSVFQNLRFFQRLEEVVVCFPSLHCLPIP